MNRRAALIVTVTLLLAAGSARANESSERLYSQGLVEFHAGRYPAALELFDQAIAADPRDAVALYYRGVTRGHLADYTAAVDDLRAAAVLPGHPLRTELELGVALVEAGRPAEAIEPLRRAEASAELAPRAAFFRGIAELRTGALDEAEVSFARARAGDPGLDLAVTYYRGLLAYERHDSATAAVLFREVADTDPESALGREAARFLDALRGSGQKAYHAFARTGFQYDSNVTLVAEDQQLPAGVDGDKRQDDGSAIFHLGGDFVPTVGRRASLRLGYDFFQSLHFDVTRYDLQRHHPFVRFTSDLDVVLLGVAGDYEYSLLSSDSFLSEWRVLPWLAVPEGDWGRSEAYYRFRDRDFKDRDFDAITGQNHSGGLRQYVFLGAPQRFLSFGYRYDNEDARVESFSYDGQEVSAGVQSPLPALILAQLGYTYRHERYAGASATTTQGRRRDNEHLVGVTLSRGFLDYFAVDLGYFYEFNGSNQNQFQYDRHIVSLTVRVDL